MVRIIDYKAGNAPSVLHAVTHLAAHTSQPDELSDATHIILPGVGSPKATMQSLRDMGLISAMEDAVLHHKVTGEICLNSIDIWHTVQIRH